MHGNVLGGCLNGELVEPFLFFSLELGCILTNNVE